MNSRRSLQAISSEVSLNENSNVISSNSVFLFSALTASIKHRIWHIYWDGMANGKQKPVKVTGKLQRRLRKETMKFAYFLWHKRQIWIMDNQRFISSIVFFLSISFQFFIFDILITFSIPPQKYFWFWFALKEKQNKTKASTIIQNKQKKKSRKLWKTVEYIFKIHSILMIDIIDNF